MQSSLPKVLHPLCGKPMLEHVVGLSIRLGATSPIVVTGHQAELVEGALPDWPLRYARQPELLGTAHAFLVAARRYQLGSAGQILLMYGDTPLLTEWTLNALLAAHRRQGGGLVLLSAELADPHGYGRVVRSGQEVLAVVEEKDASPEQRQLREVNSGVYAMDGRAAALAEKIPPSPVSGEYYLTELIAQYRSAGLPVSALAVSDPEEIMGANDRAQLATAARVMRRRINRRHLLAGVTLIDPEATYIDDGVQIGRDSLIGPGALLLGRTEIGEGCQIGAYSQLKDCYLADRAAVASHSNLEGATLAEGASAGPFARLRPGSQLDQGVQVGNFVEVKNARLGQGTKAGHLAYLGDAQIGREVNIGAGTIFANFNGLKKSETRVGDGAFIGSNAVLIAPLLVGRGAMVAAGSTIYQDVPEGSLAIARQRQQNLADRARKFWSAHRGELAAKHPVLLAWLEHTEKEVPLER